MSGVRVGIPGNGSRRQSMRRARTDVDSEHTEAGGLTREELLKRAAVGGGAILVGGSLAGVARGATDALEAAGPKRGGTFRIGVSGGSAKDFIDGQNIVTRPDQA